MFQEPLAVNRGQDMTGSMSLRFNMNNSYDVEVVLQSGAIRRSTETCLVNMDTSKQNIITKSKQVTPTLRVQVPDLIATKATPRHGAEVLVEDPLKDVKLKLSGKVESSTTETIPSKSQQPSPQSEKQVGSQIRIGDTVYTLIDEPELAMKNWQKPLVMIGRGAGIFMMEPVEKGSEPIALEFFLGSATTVPRVWLESSAANRVMKEFILRHQAPSSPKVVTAEEIDAMTLQHRSAVYAGMKDQLKKWQAANH